MAFSIPLVKHQSIKISYCKGTMCVSAATTKVSLWRGSTLNMAATCRFLVPMDARIGPALFPAIQIRLRFLQAFEALPFHRLRHFGQRDANGYCECHTVICRPTDSAEIYTRTSCLPPGSMAYQAVISAPVKSSVSVSW